MSRKRPWSSGGFALDPVADRTGPFVHRAFLRTWTEHFGTDTEVRIIDDGAGLIALGAAHGLISLLGEADLTDYHCPLGTRTDRLLADALADETDAVHFDSLPAEAVDALAEGLRLAGYSGEPRVHQSTAVLDLPSSYEDWLAGLGRKERHEIRRKTRRYEETAGSARLQRTEGHEGVAIFADLHRKAPGDKGGFMTGAMESFFASLETDVGGVVDILYVEDRPVAAAFGFEEDDVYYLYNSAYDPAERALSPGIILVTALVRAAIRSGRQQFDFLKGDEMYKTRLGAQPRLLYEIEAEKGRHR